MDTRGEDTQSDLLHKETIRHLESLLGREREGEGESGATPAPLSYTAVTSGGALVTSSH